MRLRCRLCRDRRMTDTWKSSVQGDRLGRTGTPAWFVLAGGESMKAAYKVLFVSACVASIGACGESVTSQPPGGRTNSGGTISSHTGGTTATSGGAGGASGGAGGSTTTGGSYGNGGETSTGGTVGTGGSSITGGASAASGGSNAGGSTSAGGVNTGGANSGGTVGAGGTVATGGSSATGGASAALGGSNAGGSTSAGGANTGGGVNTGGSIAAGGTTSSQYHLIKTISVGGSGSWDYLAVDSIAKRLYLSQSTQVVVVDLTTDTVVGRIPGSGVHGIAIATEFNHGFVTCGSSNTVIMFDLTTLATVTTANAGAMPDAVLYDPFSKQVFAFNHNGSSATVIDANTGAVTTTIALGGSPESAKADEAGKVYVNINSQNTVAEIDSSTFSQTNTFSLGSSCGPTGMGIDIANHRIFSACSSNSTMAVLDTQTGSVIGSVPIGTQCDGAGFDPGPGFAFASNGGGTLTVVGETSPGTFGVAQTVTTVSGARTMTIDPTTHLIYLSAQVSGSFGVLVIGP
jgi:YVTN family beta-propeller protein